MMYIAVVSDCQRYIQNTLLLQSVDSSYLNKKGFPLKDLYFIILAILSSPKSFSSVHSRHILLATVTTISESFRVV